MSPMRYSEREFPAYRHRPGVTPHPERDPNGHDYGKVRAPQVELTGENWSTHAGYLFGIDLFNAGYYWEAHVEWEELWQAASDRTDRLFLQGLVQLAAAMVKLHAGSPVGVGKLSRRAAEKFERVFGESASRFGIEKSVLAATCLRLQHGDSERQADDEAPQLILRN